jgi:sugar phosphate isomerase/epimerase
MQLSGYTYSLASLLDARKIDTAGIIRFYRQLGVDAVEITDGYVRQEEMPAIAKALSETKIRIASCDLVCNVNADDPGERAARVEKLHADLRRWAELGARTALIIPGPPRDDIPHDTSRQRFADALRESVSVAERVGITLTVANVGWQPVVYGTSDQVLGICRAVGPQLKVTYDVGNYLLAGEDNLQALQRVAPLMVHVHFKDWKIVPPPGPGAYPGKDGRLYEGEILGEGILNLPEALEHLRRLNYQGCVSVEYEGTGEPLEAARRGVAYVRSLLDAAPVRS